MCGALHLPRTAVLYEIEQCYHFNSDWSQILRIGVQIFLLLKSKENKAITPWKMNTLSLRHYNLSIDIT